MTTSTSYITVTDQFCGAGGSSQGATNAGAEVKLAMNHWELAIKTHNTNFPQTDHVCTDISACDPRRYRPTTILITSPECTNHSLAKGKMRKWQAQLDMFGTLEIDPTEERSRATMWDVPRFAEAHNYQIVIVENVVEARHWAPFDAWVQAMHLLGYKHECVYLNSMFAHPTPQSRDRMYIVFWKNGLRTPNLKITPLAYCAGCEKDVESVQSWKKPLRPWGKYKSQYVYCCPECAQEVTPYYYCAANAIDWSLDAPRIGDRARPLKEKTLKRIRIGLEKFGRQPIMMDYVHTSRNERHQDMVWTVDRPQRTQLGIHTHALVTPPFTVDLSYTHSQSAHAKTIDDTTLTQTGRQTQGIVVPPYMVDLRGENTPKALDQAVSTVCGSGNHHGLVVPPFLVSLNHSDMTRLRGIDEPMPAAMPQGNPALAIPPFLLSYNSTSQGSALSDPVPTQDTRDRHSLVVPPFIMSYYTRLSGQQAAVHGVDEALPTVPGRATHYLAHPGTAPTAEDCGFRMLQPHEIGAAMAFPSSYKVLGTQREQVKQFGNAVTPPVMEILIKRCLEVLN